MHEVAGAHHMDIVKEPKAAFWVEKFKRDLWKAQAQQCGLNDSPSNRAADESRINRPA